MSKKENILKTAEKDEPNALKTAEDEESWREKYLQFQMLQQQIEQISEHAEMLNKQMGELDITRNALKELSRTKANTEIIAPLSNGIFVKAELKENNKLIVNVGSNITVEKTVEQVITLLSKQEMKFAAKIAQANEVLEELSTEAMKIYQVIQEHVRQA